MYFPMSDSPQRYTWTKSLQTTKRPNYFKGTVLLYIRPNLYSFSSKQLLERVRMKLGHISFSPLRFSPLITREGICGKCETRQGLAGPSLFCLLS